MSRFVAAAILATAISATIAAGCGTGETDPAYHWPDPTDGPGLPTLAPISEETPGRTNPGNPQIEPKASPTPHPPAIIPTAEEPGIQSVTPNPEPEPTSEPTGPAPPKPTPTLIPLINTPAPPPTRLSGGIRWFSESDRDCLPGIPTNDTELKEMVDGMSDERRASLDDCLSAEGQLDVYIAIAEEQELSRLTHECVWKGMLPLRHAEKRQEDPDGAAGQRTSQAQHLGTRIITDYCKGKDPAWKGHSTEGGGDGVKPRWGMAFCLVEAKGGPEGFMEWMLIDDNASAEISKASTTPPGPCPREAK